MLKEIEKIKNKYDCFEKGTLIQTATLRNDTYPIYPFAPLLTLGCFVEVKTTQAV
jgi:hypothetical protein